MMTSRGQVVLVLCSALLLFAVARTHQSVYTQHKIASDAQLQQLQKDSKFANRKAVQQKDVAYGKDASTVSFLGRCKHSDVDIRWQRSVGSSIYQTPLIFDLFSDGKKEVIVPTFVRYLEVLQGRNGAEAHSIISNHRHDEHNHDDLRADQKPHSNDIHEVQQWPFSHSRFSSHASPVLYDIDKDGQLEIVQLLGTGEIVFFKQSGSIVKKFSTRVMPLKVSKNWFLGLDEAKVQTSANSQPVQQPTPTTDTTVNTQATQPIVHGEDEHAPAETAVTVEEHVDEEEDKPRRNKKKTKKANATGRKKRKRNTKKNKDESKNVKPKNYKKRKTLATPDSKSHIGHAPVSPDKKSVTTKIKKALKPGVEGWFSKEARDSMDMISHIPQSLRPFLNEKVDNPFYAEESEKELEALHMQTNHDQFVLVDPHFLSAPVIADIDNDGKDELIATVSYYFDKEHYSRPEVLSQMDPNLDLGKYISGGVIVYDLETMKKKWDVQLDMTTEKTKLKAYIYSSPTVADIDSDGNLEIIVGTALGFIYVFDKKGEMKSGWPVQMAQIQGQVIAEDVNNDGEIEICAVDFRSNLACFDYKGKIVWERQLSGFSSQAPAVGDINGDGVLELVVGTSTGHIWAVRGDNGKVVQHFPIRTGGAIYSPALIAELNTTTPQEGIFTSLLKRGIVKPSKALSIIIPSFDGYLYIVDGETGCVDKIDIGEKSYSQVLIDDLTENGKMDLLVTTMNGNVYTFGTTQSYHPLKASWGQISSLNGFAYRYNYHGIFVEPESRKFRDVIGNNFKVHFEIVDQRNLPKHMLKSYRVKISLGRQQVLLEKTYTKPGKYVEMVYAPNERMFGTVLVDMINERGQHYRDAFSVSFNMGFMGIIKWAIVIPFVLSVGTLIYMFSGKQALIPA